MKNDFAFFSQPTEQSDKYMYYAVCDKKCKSKYSFSFDQGLSYWTRNEYRKSLSCIVQVQSKKLISNGVTNTTHTSQYPISGSSHIQYYSLHDS